MEEEFYDKYMKYEFPGLTGPFKKTQKYNSIDYTKAYLLIDEYKEKIGSKKDKMKFLWELILIDDSINKDKDSRETGSLDVNVSDFIKEYKDIYNEVITENDISKEYTIKNGVIYGSYTTGFIQEFALKAEEINKLENGNYQLKISLIAALDENGNSNLDTIEKYKSNEVLSYPENVKYGNLLIEYNKSNNVNYLVNITFEK